MQLNNIEYTTQIA